MSFDLFIETMVATKVRFMAAMCSCIGQADTMMPERCGLTTMSLCMSF
jgi:hypothetical protein